MPDAREAVVTALVNKGVALGDLGRTDESLALYDAVIASYGDASDPEVREAAAVALVNKAEALEEVGRSA